jgi:hypothetical protein
MTADRSRAGRARDDKAESKFPPNDKSEVKITTQAKGGLEWGTRKPVLVPHLLLRTDWIGCSTQSAYIRGRGSLMSYGDSYNSELTRSQGLTYLLTYLLTGSEREFVRFGVIDGIIRERKVDGGAVIPVIPLVVEVGAEKIASLPVHDI